MLPPQNKFEPSLFDWNPFLVKGVSVAFNFYKTSYNVNSFIIVQQKLENYFDRRAMSPITGHIVNIISMAFIYSCG